MVGGSFLFFLIHATKEIKIKWIVSKIRHTHKTQNYDEFVTESKCLYEKLQWSFPQPVKQCHFPKYKDQRYYFPCQYSQSSQREGWGWGNHLCEESLGTVYIPPWLPKQGLKSRVHSPRPVVELAIPSWASPWENDKISAEKYEKP